MITQKLIRQIGLWGGLVSGALIVVTFSQTVNAGANQSNSGLKFYRQFSIVRLIDDDKTNFIVTRARTVAEFLNQNQINLNPKDIIKPQLKAKIDYPKTTIEIKRSRRVEIIDGYQSISIITALDNPDQIVNQAGLKIRPQDKVRWEKPSPNLKQPRPTVEIIRAKNYTVYFHNKYWREVFSTKKTVEALLAEIPLEVSNQITVYPPINSRLIKGQTIFIAQQPSVIQTTTNTIPNETIATYDRHLDPSQVIIDHAGQTGQEIIVSMIFKDNTGKNQKIIIDYKLIQTPKTQITRYGAKIIDDDKVNDNKNTIMQLAGIEDSDRRYVDFIVKAESNWSAAARNKKSGAYGLCQSLPADKMAEAGSDWRTNPITQMRWCDDYAHQRYGSWKKAYNFWRANRWW